MENKMIETLQKYINYCKSNYHVDDVTFKYWWNMYCTSALFVEEVTGKKVKLFDNIVSLVD